MLRLFNEGLKISRFSQDIQLIDKQLPSALQSVVTRKNRISCSKIVLRILTPAEIFKLFMQIILLFVAQKWLALSLPACMLVVYVVQKVYLRTSRQLRFLELEARAGVFSSFLESVCKNFR
jgi:ATP-binding cassette subfamily C (CFTR/MRP) protein 1